MLCFIQWKNAVQARKTVVVRVLEKNLTFLSIYMNQVDYILDLFDKLLWYYVG